MKTDAKAARVRLVIETKAPGDHVLVDLLDGRVYAVPATRKPDGTTRFENLPLADYPMVLCPCGFAEFARP